MRDKRSNITQWDLVPHRQDGFVGLMCTMLDTYINLYIDLLRIPFIPFSFYRMGVNGAEAATQQVEQRPEQATLLVAEAASSDTATNTEEEGSLQLREEQLQVQKQPVETGIVRLGKEVVTEQQTIHVPVTHEEVVIEHHPASGPVSETPLGKGETIRIPLSEEQVNVTKQTVATGEVTLGKRQIQETQQVSDTVRREEARIEHDGKVSIRESDLSESM